MPKIGIIAGTGIEQPLVKQPSIIFMNRHGKAHRAPHEIDARKNILALKKAGVRVIIAVAAVGAINRKMKPGDLVLLSDFIDFTRGRKEYFSPRRFTDVSEPYDPRLRNKIMAAARALKLKVHPEAIYACTEGPRFETKAEIRMYGKLGADVVGMTQVPEVVLAGEAGIPYAAIAVVTNLAAGLGPKKIDPNHVVTVMKQRSGELSRLIFQTIKTL